MLTKASESLETQKQGERYIGSNIFSLDEDQLPAFALVTEFRESLWRSPRAAHRNLRLPHGRANVRPHKEEEMKILIALLMALTSCTTAQQSPLTVTDPFGTSRLPDPRLGNENDVASAGASLMGVFTGADPLRVVVQVDFNGFTDEHQPYKYSRLFVVHFRGGFSPALQDGTVMPYIDDSVTRWEVGVSGGSNASSRGVVTLGVGRTRYSEEHALSNGGTLVIAPLQASVDGEIVPLRAGGLGACGRLAGSILGCGYEYL